MFRIYNNQYLHSSMCTLFTHNCSFYTFRLNRTFIIPKIRNGYHKFNIHYKGACLWNSLNVTKSLMNLNTFLININKHSF